MKKFRLIFCLFFCQFLLAQNDTALVLKPKIGVISVDKLNVVYRGIQNPISIAVPNAKSFTVSGLGVKEENGKYSIAPGQGKEVVVTLEIILEDDSKIIEEHLLRILNFPPVLGRINNRNCIDCIVLMKLSELENAEITVYFENLLTGLKFNVSSFSIEFSNNKNIDVNGNRIDENAFNQLKKLKKNSQFKIHNINYTKGLGGYFKKAGVINVRIAD